MAEDAGLDSGFTLSGPIGPDTLRLPGAPERLKQAVQGLSEMISQLDRTSQGLQQGRGGASDGKVAQALSHVAHRTGQVLAHDADALRDLSGALDHEADVLRDAQSGTMPELRSRWHAARVELAEAVASDQRGEAAHHGHGDGGGAGRAVEPGTGGGAGSGVDATQLARQLDDDVLADYEHLFRNWLGIAAGGGGGAGQAFAVAEDSALQEGIRRYRQTVRSVLEDYRDALMRVHGADQHVAEKLPRSEKAVFAAAPASVGGGEAQAAAGDAMTGPAAVRRLGTELSEGTQSLKDLTHSLESVRVAFRAGRMIPAGERVGSSDGFQRDWTSHFEDLTHTIEQVRHASDSIAQRLEQMEEEAARDIRQAGRADH